MIYSAFVCLHERSRTTQFIPSRALANESYSNYSPSPPSTRVRKFRCHRDFVSFFSFSRSIGEYDTKMKEIIGFRTRNRLNFHHNRSNRLRFHYTTRLNRVIFCSTLTPCPRPYAYPTILVRIARSFLKSTENEIFHLLNDYHLLFKSLVITLSTFNASTVLFFHRIISAGKNK